MRAHAAGKNMDEERLDETRTQVEAAQRELPKIAEAVARRKTPQRISGLAGAARAVAAARLIEAHPEVPVLVVCGDAKESDRMAADLGAALGEAVEPRQGAAAQNRLRAFPHPDTRPYDRFSPQPFVTAQRMDVMHRLAAGETPHPVVTAPWTALAWRTPSSAAIRSASLHIRRGETIDREALLFKLVRAGYTRQPVVEEAGEVAVRGGVIDLFPPQCERPLRIDLLGDVVESLREFDPVSQRSQAEVELLTAAPPRELLCNRELVVERADALRARAREFGVPAPTVEELLGTLLSGNLPPGAQALAGLLQPETGSLFDLLPENALIIAVDSEDGRERLERFWDDTEQHYAALAEQGEHPLCPPAELLIETRKVEAELERHRAVHLVRLDLQAPGRGLHSLRSTGNEELGFALRAARGGEAPLSPLLGALKRRQREGLRVVVAAETESLAESVRHLLKNAGVSFTSASGPAPASNWSAPGEIEVRTVELSAGFVLPGDALGVITCAEIFGARKARRRQGSLRGRAETLALARLAAGDLLVHAEHGIGAYRGMVLEGVGDFEDEFLRIEYAGNDRLFVPVHRLNLVQRFVGGDGAPPPLDKLGAGGFERRKRKAKKRVRVLARQLLELHAAREMLPGFAFPPRDDALRAFEARFPYEETPDQAAAIEDTLADLARPRPMDRLICGDVGFGKTEVAARAAHQVLMAGKQVAVLAPTTVLCRQHIQTFRERFQELPVRIEELSRFCTRKETQGVLEGLQNGAVDLVVGTHRLLQKNVAFRDLGLLVVDEEHRFGVAQKERIKRWKQDVDVLTLTATPIPRTLQMAFENLRDISTIETPPEGRLSVRTRLARFDETLIREAVLREVARGGQVFFVHNRVKTIYALAKMLGELIPEVRLRVAHGQMPERELETHALAFMKGEFDLLLCTTIIESGLDIPRAGTILIDHADALGLAQLYQLRGRVGRSNRRAYAYLLISGERARSAEAVRRLEALQELAELGSGFRLANLDLEIRGAGDLLGGEQSGHLSAIGYHGYMELLEQAVRELRGEQRAPAVDPEIRLPVPARLPESYVQDTGQRLVLYRELAGAETPERTDALLGELLDRFGPAPQEVQNLVEVIRIKIAARELGLSRVELEAGRLVLTLSATHRIDPARLAEMILDKNWALQLDTPQRISCPVPQRRAAELFAHTGRLLAELRRAPEASPEDGGAEGGAEP